MEKADDRYDVFRNRFNEKVAKKEYKSKRSDFKTKLELFKTATPELFNDIEKAFQFFASYAGPETKKNMMGMDAPNEIKKGVVAAWTKPTVDRMLTFNAKALKDKVDAVIVFANP